MGMVVNNNIPALLAYNSVTKTNSSLQKSIQKLSTGLRINSAADDAAGLAISEKMRAQIRGLDRAMSNSQDGISMIQTAEGALNETHSILQRMRELSVQSANDTLTQQDRGYIQLEIDQLREEITRIGNTTQFNKKKLLDGSAAVLWSSDNLNTKAIVNGGLRQIDQFGQKSALEGNYEISVKAKAGQGEIQKSDIFKIKHKNVITDVNMDASFLRDVRVDNLPKGDYRVMGHSPAAIDTPALVDYFGTDASALGAVLSATMANVTGTLNILVEVVGINTSTSKVTFKVSAEQLKADGTNHYYSEELTVGTADTSQTLFKGVAGLSGLNLAFSGMEFSNVVQTGYKVGNKAVVQLATQESVGMKVSYAGNTSYNNGVVTAAFQFDTPVMGNTVTFKNFYLDKETGKVTRGSILLDTKAVASPADGLLVASFHATKIGDVAKSDVKLRDLDKFWDAQGRFMLNDPQTITITQGNGKQAKVTLYGDDTLGSMVAKFNDAIGNTLGQAEYVKGGTHFATFVDAASGDIESVNGTFLLRSAVPGAAGKLSLAGDEDLIKAFSLNQIQAAKDSTYTVSIKDAHSGAPVATETVTGNRLIGVVNSNIDVEFDAMAGITATWDSASRTYVYSPSTEDYTTILHLADNTTVFQIGANEGEDMGINIGDMRASALGLNEVLVTDREAAARSITVIDNALDKVSTQRAKLGAYQNRLEHTISNLTVAGENLTAAESRIRDTDMAKEMMNFTKLNIMLQAGNAMLAQANQLPQNVLSLIR